LSPLHNSKSQSVITIPVTYTGAIPLEAIQLGLRFNPSKFALIGPSQGDVPNWNAGNFGLTKTSSGEIRTLWIPDFSDPFHRIQPGDILFYLSFRKLTNSEDASNPVSLDGNILDNLTWNASDQEMTLQEETSSAERSVEHTVDSTPLQASCTPNPTTGSTSLTVDAAKSGKGTLMVFGPFGNLLLTREVDFISGAQTYELPETGKLPSGVYIWKFNTLDTKVSGRLIKL
jgi:hypothetical protein